MTSLKSIPLRIGLISDTHIPRDADMIPPYVWEAFVNLDLILHAGDIYVSEVLDQLETVAPVVAARGNGDWDIPEDPRLGTHCIVKIVGRTIGLSHALHYSDDLKNTSRKMIERQFGQLVDIIIVGDTHIATMETYKGVILINPGSPTVPIGSLEIGTVGILEITENKTTTNIIHFK
jgi:putative phosphoesterase